MKGIKRLFIIFFASILTIVVQCQSFANPFVSTEAKGRMEINEHRQKILFIDTNGESAYNNRTII